MSLAKMNCPKCKSEIKNNSIKCPVCSTRIGRNCPTCGEYNLITNKKCSSCGAELLKSCPHCKAINVPTATKCGQPMKIETPVVEPPKIETPRVEIEPDIVQKLQEAPVIKEVVKEEPKYEEPIKQEEQIEVQTENITEENSSENTSDAEILYEIEEKRDEFTKHFQMDDGTIMAAVYKERVHYLEGEEYKEIDGSLSTSTEDGDKVFTTSDGVLSVKFANKSGNKLLTIGKGNEKIKVFKLEKNRGKGYALNYGLDIAMKNADINQDNKINIKDWNALYNYLNNK